MVSSPSSAHPASWEIVAVSRQARHQLPDLPDAIIDNLLLHTTLFGDGLQDFNGSLLKLCAGHVDNVLNDVIGHFVLAE